MGILIFFHLFIISQCAFIPATHPFKMSVCEISYVEEKKSFDVRFYLFQDDLKETLYSDPESPILRIDSVTNYILKKVRLSLADQQVSLNFKEFKEKEDQVMVVFQSDKIILQPKPNLLVSNRLLIEKFKTQTNMVYLSLPGRSKLTQILNAKKTEGRFN